MNFLVVGYGERTVETVEGESESAPVLTIEYVRTEAVDVNVGFPGETPGLTPKADVENGGNDVVEQHNGYVLGRTDQLYVGRQNMAVFESVRSHCPLDLGGAHC